VVTGADLEWLKTVFVVGILVSANVGADGVGDCKFAGLDAAGEGVELGAVDTNAVGVGGGNPGKGAVVEAGNVGRGRAVYVADAAVESHWLCLWSSGLRHVGRDLDLAGLVGGIDFT